MNRVTVSMIKAKVSRLNRIARQTAFDYETGSKVNGIGWKLTDASGSHIYIYASSARDLAERIDSFIEGIYFAQALAESEVSV